MAHCQLISCICLLLLLVPSNSIGSIGAFGFLKNLEGCKKGENLAGLRKLKQYLNQFGYLNYHSSKAYDNDDFDDFLEAAIKTYQANFNLNVTGILDSETVSKMMTPRCGVPDIVTGVNTMRKNHHNRKTLHTVSHYSFFRWPVGRFDLSNMISDAKLVFVRAFDKWASSTD